MKALEAAKLRILAGSDKAFVVIGIEVVRVWCDDREIVGNCNNSTKLRLFLVLLLLSEP